MKYIDRVTYKEERSLFKSDSLTIHQCVFEDGESPLKESANLDLFRCEFRWKYPLWYCNNVKCNSITFSKTARSGIWYTNNIEINNSNIYAQKTFRRCTNIKLNCVNLPDASETLWDCKKIEMNRVSAKGDYFGFNSEDIEINDLQLDGNYCFDGAKNIVITNSILNSKDSFWNCENVKVVNSTIYGEYLGWNSKNITFINCKIISHQGLCYINGLKMINCKLIDSDLCFEFCENIDADIVSEVESIKNPISGKIQVKGLKELIRDRNLIDPNKTEIIVNNEKI